MIEKLLAKLGLTPQQQKTIMLVFKISLGGCLTLVAVAWAMQTIGIKRKLAKEKALSASATEQLTTYFEKKSKDLLPVDIEAHEFAAQYYLKNDQPKKAIDHLLRIMPLQKTNMSLKLELATAYLQSAQYGAAFEELTKLSEADTGAERAPAIAARLGLTLFYLGKIKESIETLNACIAKYPRCAEALCYVGQVQAATAEGLKMAEQYFQKAVEIDPGYLEAWYQRARLCMSQNDYLRSREYLLKALEIEPLNVKAQARLGMAYYYLNEPESAKKAYQTALALNPFDCNTHYNLGELYYSKLNDSAAALSEFKKALEGNPAHAEANFRTGVICLGNNMVKEAIGYLETARQAMPSNIRVLLQLGVAYEKLDMKDEALRIYRQILDMDELNQVARQKMKLLTSG